MKYFCVFLFLFLYNTSYSQRQDSVKITYKINFNLFKNLKFTDDLKKQYVKEMDKKTQNISNKISYTLSVNNQASVFKMDDVLLADKEMYLLGFFKKGIHYVDGKNNYIVKKDVNGEIFLIHKKIHKNWIITSESKVIKGYKCFKAIQTEKRIIKNKIHKNKIIAWFCPSLNYSYGPLGYGGLPGLILELEKKNEIKFFVDEIVINPMIDLKINKPKNGIIVTEEEYNKLRKKMYLQRIQKM